MQGPIAIIARIRAAPGKDKLLASLLTEQAAAVRAAEPGCMTYKLHQSRTDPCLFIFYEQYVDDAARAAHQDGAHMLTFRERRVSEGLVQGAVEVDVLVPLTNSVD